MNRLVLLYNSLQTKLVCCIFIIMMFVGNSAHAQLPLAGETKINYAGQDFWYTLRSPLGTGLFAINSATDAYVTFEYPFNPSLNKNYIVKGGEALRIGLTATEMQAMAGGSLNQPSGTVNNASVHISSDKDITVQFLFIGGANDDGILILPSDKQYYSYDYYLNGARMSYGGGGQGYYTIVSRCDSVVLEITPSRQTATQPAGVPYTIVMKRGNSYVLKPNADDLSGTTIRVKYTSCCNPINTFIDNDATYMKFPFPQPNAAGWIAAGCCADRLMDMVLPVNTWDTVYPVVAFANNQYNVIKIVSASNNNRVSFDGVYIRTLNDKDAYDTIIEKGIIITATAPISITQHMVSQTETHRGAFAAAGGAAIPIMEDSLSDPASLWVLSLRDGLRDAYFKAFGYNLTFPYNTSYRLNYATIICKATSINTILLNKVNIASQFVPFPNNPTYMYAYIRLDTVQTYHLESKDRILAYYYGMYKEGSTLFNIGDAHASGFVTAPVRTFKPDSFTVCTNDPPVTLSASGADQYLWSNGDTTSKITVADTGLYSVQMHYKDSCGRGGTKLFRVILKPYAQEATKDTLKKCPKDSLVLVARAADKYLWSNGDTANNIKVTAMGDAYHVMEMHQSQCLQINHAFAVLPKPVELLPRINLGADTTICRGIEFTLIGGNSNIRWSNGSTGEKLTIKDTGTYWASLTESCYGQFVSDTIVITDSLCLTAVDTLNSRNYCGLFFPNAFTPNADGHNDVFRGIIYGAWSSFTAYHLSIYNRWGVKVFETNDVKGNWDGIYNGVPADIGVYYYICTYSCPYKEDLFVKGEVTLIK